MKTAYQTKKIAAAAILAVTAMLGLNSPVQAQYYQPVSPNANWKTNLNGGGSPIGMQASREGKLLQAIGGYPGLSSGNLEEDRRAVEAWRQRTAREGVMRQIEAERIRHDAANGAQTQPAPKSSAQFMPDLLDVRKQVEELARRHLEGQLNGKTPAMSADTKPDWEREIWKLNQHLLVPQE